MTKDNCYKLIRAVRRNWQEPNWDSDRSIRSIAMAILQYKSNGDDEEDEAVMVALRATIDEINTRATYKAIKEIFG